jgi:hypothetical protein
MSAKAKRPDAATATAVFLSLFTAAIAPPTAPAAVRDVPVVQQQTLQQEKPATQNNAPANAQTLGQMDRPRRLRYQRRNPFRQVRRRMERQGFDLTGRQWRNLMKLANRLRMQAYREAEA